MGLTLCQKDAMHSDVLVSQRLLACLLVKREEGRNRAHAPGFEFVVGTALSSTDCGDSLLLDCGDSLLLSRTSQTASSLQRYCGYQQNVLSWVVCVRHGSTYIERDGEEEDREVEREGG